MANRPKASDWKKYDELLSAGTKGWNALSRLPVILRKEFPWLNEFDFGFFAEDDLLEMRAQGWDFLSTEHFDPEELTRVVGVHFGFTEAAGHVKYRNNYIMIQHKDYREKLKRRRNEEAERIYQAQIESTPHVDGSIGSESDMDERNFTVMDPEEKPKRGRPPKSK
jgi:hypothetical protein